MDQVVAGLLFTLAGALVGALAAVYSARLTAHRQHLYSESAKFRAEFVHEIMQLRSANEDAFRILDEAAMARHKKAKVLFEPWVPDKKIRGFNDSWKSYENSLKTTAPGSLDNRQAECESALAGIRELLSYAKYKG